MMTKPLLLTLNEISATDLQLVGAKALNLARLRQNNLPVPQGIVVTSAFFETQVTENSLRPIWEGSPNVAVTEDALQFLADFLKSKPLVDHLNAALQQKLANIFPPSIQSFAVRSSAIDEDSHSFSFAGVHLTELAVPRDLIPVSITRCWASTLTGPALRYRLQNSIPIRQIKIAILIQPMLKPEAAGVAFTINPVSGVRDEMVVEAAATLGEAVVRGTTTPFRYNIRRQPPLYPITQKHNGDSMASLREPLDAAQLQLLAQALERIEALMGSPQDVEWAFSGGKLHILQARPISTGGITGSAPDFQPAAEISAEWTRANHPETLPELPSVLFSSLMVRTQMRGISFFERMGLNISGLGAYIKLFYGRPYLNLNIIKEVLTQMGLNPVPMLVMVGYMNGSSLANPFSVSWKTVWRARKIYRNFWREVRRVDTFVQQYRQNTDRIIAALDKIPATTDDLLTQFRFREQVYGDLMGVGLVVLSAITGLMVAIAKLVEPFIQSDTDVFRTLGTLGKDPATIRHNIALWQLSRIALREPPVVAYLTRSFRLNDYRTALAGTEFLTAFEEYLTECGHLSTYPADMGFPRYAEQPEFLLQAIAGYTQLAEMRMVQSAKNADGQAVGRLWQQLTAGGSLRHRIFPWRKWLAHPLLRTLHRMFSLRTEMFAAQAQAMAAIRRWDLSLAKKWAAAKLINTPDDYFWLTMEEIEQVLASSLRTIAPLQPTIAARRDAYRAYWDLSLPLVVRDSDVMNFEGEEDAASVSLEDTLLGLSVSPGLVQGRISFLSDYDSVEDVPRGQILVAPSTDPAYLPYFPLAAGLIVERGGMLSHGSIIAREYGLPAVSNIDARHQLHPGDRVLLDGSTGVVQVLERAK